jgi:hypothetical protein
MTAFPLKAEVHPRYRYVAKVPLGDICTATNCNVYSITSSASASRVGGTSRPSAWALR